MIRFAHILLASIWLLSGMAEASQGQAKQEPLANSVTRIEGESDKALSIVTVGLAAKPSWSAPEVQDHGTFIQVVLPSTIVPEPGTFIDANSPFITKIAAFQVNNPASGQPTDAAIRLFVNRDAAAVREAVVAEILADRLVVTLDHKKLEAQPATPGAILAPAATEERDPTPAELVRGDAPAENLASGWPAPGIRVPDLSGKLSIVAGFSAFMLLLMGAVYRFKRINPLREGAFSTTIQNPVRKMKNAIKHRVPQSEDGEDYVRDITMKTISTMNVGPRQKLALVKVGTETILLSVTPSGVQFLTNIGSSTRGATAAAAPFFPQAAGAAALPAATFSQGDSFEERLAATETVEEAPQPPSHNKVQTRPALKGNGRQGASATRKVRVAVGDNGVSNLEEGKEAPASKAAREDAKPSDDITRMIREKLRNLPVI